MHEHEHTHEHTHTHPHHHPHGTELDKTLALINYMLEHNRQHTSELEKMEAKLLAESKPEAAALLMESVMLYRQGNDRLADSLKKAKEA